MHDVLVMRMTGNLVITSGQLPLCYGKLIEPGGSGNLEHLYEGFTKGCADAALAASNIQLLNTQIFQFRL